MYQKNNFILFALLFLTLFNTLNSMEKKALDFKVSEKLYAQECYMCSETQDINQFTVFTCNHSLCNSCISLLTNNKCPLCQVDIEIAKCIFCNKKVDLNRSALITGEFYHRNCINKFKPNYQFAKTELQEIDRVSTLKKILSERNKAEYEIIGERIIHDRTICGIAFSPCGNFLAKAMCGKIEIFDFRKLLRELPKNVRTTENGKFNYIEAEDLDKCLLKDQQEDAVISATEFSHCGNYLAYSINDGSYFKIKIWDFLNNTSKNISIAHENYIFTLKYSPNGKYLFSGSEDKTIKIRDADTLQCVYTFNENNSGSIGKVGSIKFSFCGRYCMAVCSDSKMPKVKIWDLQNKICIATFSDEGGPLATDEAESSWDNKISICNNYKFCFVDNDLIQILEIKSNKCIAEFEDDIWSTQKIYYSAKDQYKIHVHRHRETYQSTMLIYKKK